ncbi:glutamate receptor 4 [Patella vulgata]|uniref:glutamate receptor 4 n=1 Tax=Patella vulgata TaxID=6465 RepID=UPI0024A8F3C2|nr:glutamate receptor 4 [Patella vulgata]
MTSAATTISATYSMCSTDSHDVNWKNNISQELSQTNTIGSMGKLQFDDHGYPVGLKFIVCSFHNMDPDKFKNIGYWASGTGLMLVDSTVYQNIFTDFGNRTLVIGALPAEPFNMKTTVGNITKWEGFCIDILNEMAEKFNFHYVISEPADRIWGSPVEDGTWNGIVGQVVKGNYAFGVGPFTITSVREAVIDFTKPYMEEGIGILIRKPNSESKKMFKMFIPFAPEVWGCIVAGVIAVGVLLYIVNRITPYSNHKLYSKTDQMMLKESIWLVYGSYMEQGGDPQPKSISGRLILGFWWLFTILMTSTYTANLAAFLTVTIAEKPINSLTELSEQSDILPLAKYGSNLYTLFKEANGGIYQDVWNMMGNMPRITNNQDARKLVEQGFTAFMTDRSQLEYIVLNDCETYSLADESFNTAGLGFIMPENAVFSDAFNYHIMKMQEAGLIDKWKQKWWPSSDQCSGSDRTSQAQTLGLESLAGPFFIFLSVAGSAGILLLIELVYYSKGFVGLTKCLKISGNQEPPENEKE